MNGTCRYGARCRFLHNREDACVEVKRGPWASDPVGSFFSPSANSPSEFDTKTGEDSHGVIGEAKSAGTRREQRHEQAVLSLIGLVSAPKQQQKQQNGVCKFSMETTSRTWADLTAKGIKPEPPPMPPPNLTQTPEMKNDATFSGLFGARWGTF